MTVNHGLRRFHLWLATVVMAFAALAPTVSHALALSSGAPLWAEVCSAQGTSWVNLLEPGDERPTDPTQSVGGHFDHCPFCHLPGPDAAPPPAALATALHPTLGIRAPELAATTVYAGPAWHPAQPRAPPPTLPRR